MRHKDVSRFYAWAWIISFLVCLTSASLVHGEAFRNLHQGTAATGQGDAFAAQADDPSAVFYNPAGMTQLEGFQLYAGTLIVGGYYDYTSPAGQEFRGNLDGTVANPPPSFLYVTANLDQSGIELFQDLSIGLGLNSPFGLLIRWPDDVPFSAIDVFGTLPLLDIKPTAAYRVNDYLSIGGGLDIYTFASFLGEGNTEVRNFIPPSTTMELNLTDTALGWNIGTLLTLWQTAGKPRVNFAFVYRSQATLELTGPFLLNGGQFADAEVDLELPQVFTWGLAVWPFRDDAREWKAEVNLDYADWSSFKDLNIRDANTGAILSPQPRNWKGVFVIKVGTEYKWLRLASMPEWEVALRAGYIRSETPVPERTFEPLVPDADFNGVSIGLGLMCKGEALFLGWFKCDNGITKAIALDFTYVNQLYETRTINNNLQPALNGTYDTALHAGGIGLRLNF